MTFIRDLPKRGGPGIIAPCGSAGAASARTDESKPVGLLGALGKLGTTLSGS